MHGKPPASRAPDQGSSSTRAEFDFGNGPRAARGVTPRETDLPSKTTQPASRQQPFIARPRQLSLRAKLGLVGVLFAFSLAPSALADGAGRSEATEPRLVVATPGGLTAREVAVRAKSTGLNIKARGRALAAAEAGLTQAWAAFLPKLTLTARYTRLSSYRPTTLQTLPNGGLDAITTDPRVNADPSSLALATDIVQAYNDAASRGSQFPIIANQFWLQAALIVPVSDYALKLSQRYSAASHSVRAAVSTQRAARAAADADARILFYTWLLALGEAAVAERSLEQARQHLEDSEHQLKAGLVASADVASVQAQVANAELVLQGARSVLELRQEQIHLVMHDTGTAHYVPGEDLSFEAESYDLLSAPVEDLQNEAFMRRPELKTLDESAASLAQQSKAIRADGLPQLSVFGSVTTARPNPRIIPATDRFQTTWEVGAQVIWAPTDTPAAYAASAQAHAKSEELSLQRAELRDSVALEVFDAYRQLKQSRFAAATTAREVSAAEQAYSARRDLFRSGQTTSATFTDAELDLVRAQLAVVNSMADLQIARVRLEHALGRDVN